MTLSRSYGHCFHSILDTTLPILVLAKEAHKTYITAPAKDVVAPLLGGLFPTSRVNHLLALASRRWARHRWFCMALTSYVDQPLPLLPKRRKRFLRMYFVRFSNALLPVERKQRLVSEGTATTKKRESFPMLVPVHTRQGVWSLRFGAKRGRRVGGLLRKKTWAMVWSFMGGAGGHATWKRASLEWGSKLSACLIWVVWLSGPF